MTDILNIIGVDINLKSGFVLPMPIPSTLSQNIKMVVDLNCVDFQNFSHCFDFFKDKENLNWITIFENGNGKSVITIEGINGDYLFKNEEILRDSINIIYSNEFRFCTICDHDESAMCFFDSNIVHKIYDISKLSGPIDKNNCSCWLGLDKAFPPMIEFIFDNYENYLLCAVPPPLDLN